MTLNSTPLFVGTSGYNHEDWKGSFAPSDITNYDLLSYYADKGFNFLELAFTFYRIPEEDKIKNILSRTGDKVKFSIRIPKVIIKNPSDTASIDAFFKGIRPIIDNGLLACVYADYLPSFSACKKSQEQIIALKNLFTVPFFAELNNRTWYKQRIVDLFRENNVGMVIIDSPSLAGLAPYYPISTNNNLYFKLYGRSKNWLTIDNRILDYNYSDNELKRFLTDAVDRSVLINSIFVSFANLADGRAPFNALRFRELAEDYK